MSKLNSNDGCLIIVGLLIISAIIGAFCWPYAINTWLVFFGRTPKVLWYHGVLLGFVPYVGKLSVAVAALTWVMMLILV